MAYDEISQILTVSECNALIKRMLDESFYQVVVRGEISGTSFRPNSSGHYYFDLKDRDASIPCCVFRSMTRGLEKFKVGDLVVATGRISYYEKGGKLSFIITKMVLEGDGELQALIEKRKAYYQNLGWFDEQYKPPIPEKINSIGVITSATGAVIHDILNVTRRRAPGVNIILFPCAVQGKGAETTIASRIRQANNFSSCDVLIVARGGGSKEDLMPYNEDEVIEAIHNSKIPVISAVGHESDWSLSDYVATLRAGTPSIAAEIVTKDIFLRRTSFLSIRDTMRLVMEKRLQVAESSLPDVDILTTLIKNKIDKVGKSIKGEKELRYLLENKMSSALMRLSFTEESMRREISKKLDKDREKVESIKRIYTLTLPRILDNAKAVIKDYRKTSSLLLSSSIKFYSERVKSTKKEMSALNPLSILERGFALVRDENGRIITTKNAVDKGDSINITLKDGDIKTIVEEIK